MLGKRQRGRSARRLSVISSQLDTCCPWDVPERGGGGVPGPPWRMWDFYDLGTQHWHSHCSQGDVRSLTRGESLVSWKERLYYWRLSEVTGGDGGHLKRLPQVSSFQGPISRHPPPQLLLVWGRDKSWGWAAASHLCVKLQPRLIKESRIKEKTRISSCKIHAWEWVSGPSQPSHLRVVFWLFTSLNRYLLKVYLVLRTVGKDGLHLWSKQMPVLALRELPFWCSFTGIKLSAGMCYPRGTGWDLGRRDQSLVLVSVTWVQALYLSAGLVLLLDRFKGMAISLSAFVLP